MSTGSEDRDRIVAPASTRVLVSGVCYRARWYPCPDWIQEALLKGTTLTLVCNGPLLRDAHKYESAGRAWYLYHGRYFEATVLGEGGGHVRITARERSAAEARAAGVTE